MCNQISGYTVAQWSWHIKVTIAGGLWKPPIQSCFSFSSVQTRKLAISSPGLFPACLVFVIKLGALHPTSKVVMKNKWEGMFIRFSQSSFRLCARHWARQACAGSGWQQMWHKGWAGAGSYKPWDYGKNFRFCSKCNERSLKESQLCAWYSEPTVCLLFSITTRKSCRILNFNMSKTQPSHLFSGILPVLTPF